MVSLNKPLFQPTGNSRETIWKMEGENKYLRIREIYGILRIVAWKILPFTLRGARSLSFRLLHETPLASRIRPGGFFLIDTLPTFCYSTRVTCEQEMMMSKSTALNPNRRCSHCMVAGRPPIYAWTEDGPVLGRWYANMCQICVDRRLAAIKEDEDNE